MPSHECVRKPACSYLQADRSGPAQTDEIVVVLVGTQSVLDGVKKVALLRTLCVGLASRQHFLREMDWVTLLTVPRTASVSIRAMTAPALCTGLGF